MTNQVRTFTTGAIRDNDSTKEDYVETISYRALKRYAQYMTGKKAKYGSGNFKKGIPTTSYEQSLMRHIQKYFVNKYEGGNEEVNEDHLAAIIFNVCGIMHEESKGEDMNKDMVKATENIIVDSGTFLFPKTTISGTNGTSDPYATGVRIDNVKITPTADIEPLQLEVHPDIKNIGFPPALVAALFGSNDWDDNGENVAATKRTCPYGNPDCPVC